MTKQPKKFTLVVSLLVGIAAVAFSGCGPSRREKIQVLQAIDQKIEDSKNAPCDAIHQYLARIQMVVRTAIAELE